MALDNHPVGDFQEIDKGILLVMGNGKYIHIVNAFIDHS
jgi:hypothetical protein